MKAISTGNVYRIYDDTLKTYDKLPAQPYVGLGFFVIGGSIGLVKRIIH